MRKFLYLLLFLLCFLVLRDEARALVYEYDISGVMQYIGLGTDSYGIDGADATVRFLVDSATTPAGDPGPPAYNAYDATATFELSGTSGGGHDGIFAADYSFIQLDNFTPDRIRLGAYFDSQVFDPAVGPTNFETILQYSPGFLGPYPFALPTSLSGYNSFMAFPQLGGAVPGSIDYYYFAYELTDVTVSAGVVPEPATILLLGAGLIGLAGFGRKKFKK